MKEKERLKDYKKKAIEFAAKFYSIAKQETVFIARWKR